MKNKLFNFFLFAAVVSGVLIFHKSAQAAILFVSPEHDTVDQNQTVVAEVRLDSEKQIINVVQGRITYDPQILEFVEASKAGSFFSLWPEEPKADTTAGVITFAGGAPNGSYAVNGKVLTLVFKGKSLGLTKIDIDSGTSGVYLNDGLGTKANLTVKGGAITVQVPTSTLDLLSPTHPDENTWYKSKEVKFTWNVAKDAMYVYVFSSDPAALPDERFAVRTGEISFANTEDGIHYFILKERLPNDKWAEPIRRRVQIDSTQPEPIIYKLTRDVAPDKLVLVFSSKDGISQIAKYQIIEGDQITENATSPYILKDQKQSQAIIIKAYDSAGNMQEVTIPAASPSVAKNFNIYWTIAAGLGALILLVVRLVLRRKSRKNNLAK
ncbi:MAG: hypothetical protein COT26_01725 [Candidatus Kerfeldbacteria bacterium CG08_land_8_20_14_0_20_43_14]|uniref:Cohesin domain-containing protein n=1 Tax=Candidatus Kerfeldbacteria bacterium CG08_land_8_20_14_0_20_43_14 TaxID=2014246 RepID=A0A2H0YQN3_9BACT|nr:MAG: hypothetical protein COT26_01725 [Candidatus Kerfeldbacteria bacterium CG08_land_8_20_14_0_20_43_14]